MHSASHVIAQFRVYMGESPIHQATKIEMLVARAQHKYEKKKKNREMATSFEATRVH